MHRLKRKVKQYDIQAESQKNNDSVVRSAAPAKPMNAEATMKVFEAKEDTEDWQIEKEKKDLSKVVFNNPAFEKETNPTACEQVKPDKDEP